jgi:hypothetical protein
MYEIKNGAVTIYVDPLYDGATFEFKGLTVEGDETFYQKYDTKNKPAEINGRPCAGLDGYLLTLFKRIADEQLAGYLDQHINDMDVYDIKGGSIQAILSDTSAEPDTGYSSDVSLNQVIDGIVGYRVNNVICLHNLISKTVVGFKRNNSGDKTETTPMNIFYGDRLAVMLSLEQYKRGMAPPFVTELMRLRLFLNGKKSAKLIMRDGSVHEYKPRNGGDVKAGRLICFDADNAAEPFYLADFYDIRPRFNRRRQIADLDYLQFGKEKFYLNAAALNQLK